MRQVVVIPARYASSRLPAKPLLDIGGKPMLQWVYERAQQAGLDQTVIATDDSRIQSAMEQLGFVVCMTSAQHQSGTDRLAEVVSLMQLDDQDLVINVQGDEPLIPVAVIQQVRDLLLDNTGASMATLSVPITEVESLHNPNIVKVVANNEGQAIYFSRAPIPWHRDSENHNLESSLSDYAYRRHIGLYAYRAGFLKEFSQWPSCALEITERLEQLRALWHGRIIQIADAIEPVPEGIDTEADLMAVRAIIDKQKLS